MQEPDDLDRYAMAWQAARHAELRCQRLTDRAHRLPVKDACRPHWLRLAARAARRAAQHVEPWRAEPPCHRYWNTMHARAHRLDVEAGTRTGGDNLYGV